MSPSFPDLCRKGGGPSRHANHKKKERRRGKERSLLEEKARIGVHLLAVGAKMANIMLCFWLKGVGCCSPACLPACKCPCMHSVICMHNAEIFFSYKRGQHHNSLIAPAQISVFCWYLILPFAYIAHRTRSTYIYWSLNYCLLSLFACTCLLVGCEAIPLHLNR